MGPADYPRNEKNIRKIRKIANNVRSGAHSAPLLRILNHLYHN